MHRVIDLRYAKVTPGLTSSNKANNVFQIRYAIIIEAVEMHVNMLYIVSVGDSIVYMQC
jgi:hypothetical protein